MSDNTFVNVPLDACIAPLRATSKSKRAIFCESNATLHLIRGRKMLMIFRLEARKGKASKQNGDRMLTEQKGHSS